MQPLVYYPGFEPGDEHWVKFALLYLDNVTPIIPESGDSHLSEDFRYLRDCSDLFSPLRPNDEEGAAATADAVDQVERILQHPERFEHIFGMRDVTAEWKRPTELTTELFDEKYSWQWQDFCTANQVGRKSDHGVIVSRSLANLYMTVLAHAVADSRGASPITDVPLLDNYAMFLRHEVDPTESAEQLTVVRDVMKMQVPDLDSVSLERILRFRNRPDIEGKRRDFHSAMNSYFASVEYRRNAQDFVKDLRNSWGVLTDEVLKIGAGVATFGLGVWIAIDSPNFDLLRALGQLAGGSSLAVGSVIVARNAWRNTKVKRFARRYLSDLHGLRP